MKAPYVIKLWVSVCLLCVLSSLTSDVMAQENEITSPSENTQAAWVSDAIQMLEFIEEKKLILHEHSFDDYEKLVLSAPSAEKLNRLYGILIDAAFNNSDAIIDKYLPLYIEEIESSASREHQEILEIFNVSRDGLFSQSYDKTIKALEEIAFDENTHANARIRALSIVGYLYGYTGNTDHIVTTLQKMEAIADKAPDHIVIKKEILGLKGFLASYTNDPESMVKYSSESILLDYQNKSLIYGAISAENFTHLVMENGNLAAIEKIEALNQRIAYMTGNDYYIFRAYMKCGEFAVKLNRNAKALTCFDDAESYIDKSSKPHIPYYLYSAIAYARSGQVEKARANLETAKNNMDDETRNHFQKTLNLAISEVLHAEGSYAEAYNRLRAYFNGEVLSQKKELGEVTKSLREYSDEKAALLREKNEVLAGKEGLQARIISRQRILISVSVLFAMALLSFVYFLKMNTVKLRKAREKTIKANQVISLEARTDQLTRIGNRRAFYEYSQAVKNNSNYQKYALGILDLDGFKMINDTYGHEAGDLIIQKTASRLHQALEGKGRVFRLGGDEFAIVFSSQDDAALNQFKECITHALKKPVIFKSKKLALNWSVGAIVIVGENQNLHAFLHQADYALYQAKEQKGPSFHIFSDEDADNIRLETQLTEEVNWNLETASFTMFGQVIADSTHGNYQLFGVEALVRAQSRSGEALSPDAFIKHVVSVGKTSLFTKLSLMKSIQMLEESGLHCPLLFNLSRNQIIDVNVFQIVSEVLEQAAFPPERLIIELSESTLKQDLSIASETLYAFKQLGIRIALDDFGSSNTGFSSLVDFKFDIIKTDRNLLLSAKQSVPVKYLMSNLIDISQKLGVLCIIEGVETSDEVLFVERIGGQVLQGFIFGRPEEVPKFRTHFPWVKTFELEPSAPSTRKQKKSA